MESFKKFNYKLNPRLRELKATLLLILSQKAWVS